MSDILDQTQQPVPQQQQQQQQHVTYVDHMAPPAPAPVDYSDQVFVSSYTNTLDDYMTSTSGMTASPAASTTSSNCSSTTSSPNYSMTPNTMIYPEPTYAYDYVEAAPQTYHPPSQKLSFDYTYDQKLHANTMEVAPPPPLYGSNDGLIPTSAPPSITTFQQAAQYQLQEPIKLEVTPNVTPSSHSTTPKQRKKSTSTRKSSATGAPPGPIPATTPCLVKRDEDGVEWISFEYSKERVKTTYCIRCDIEKVDKDALEQSFKEENCIYPRACVPKDQYTGNRQKYETECNTIGWGLAKLNPDLRGQRGLIQRAVDSWRNTNADPSVRSRRVRRQSKKSISNASSAATSPPTIQKRSRSVCEPGVTPMANRSCSQPTLALHQHSYPSAMPPPPPPPMPSSSAAMIDFYQQPPMHTFNNPFAPGPVMNTFVPPQQQQHLQQQQPQPQPQQQTPYGPMSPRRRASNMSIY